MRTCCFADSPRTLFLLSVFVLTATGAAAQPDKLDSETDQVKTDAVLQTEIEPILARIDRLRLEGGRYNPELSDAALTLGLAYRRAGKHEQAARAFAEGAIIVRANRGLHELGQMHYLELLAEEYTALARVDKLVAVHRQMYWLHQNAWGESDPRLLPVIERIVRGQTGLSSENGPEMVTSGNALINCLMEDWLEIAESAFEPDDRRLIESHYARARIYYDIARSAGRGVTEHLDARRDPRAMPRRAANFGTSGGSARQPTQNPLTLVIRRAEQGGRAALEAVVKAFSAGLERDPEMFTEPLAVALLHLGDWHVLFGTPGSRGHYRQAQRLLSQNSNDPARFDELFEGAPMLPAAVRFSRYSSAAMAIQLAARQPTIEVSFEVTTSGRAENFDVIHTAPELKESAAILVEILSGNRFRPMLEDGKLIGQRVTRRFARVGAESFIQLDRRQEYVNSAALAASARPAGVAAGAPL